MARVLILTLPPFTGGVPAKTEILARHLRACGHQVTVAYYATLSDHPDLAAPSWRIPRGARPGLRQVTCFGDFPGAAAGCWLPELEFSYYLPSRRWQALLNAHDRHIAVGGTSLVSYPLARAGIPHLTWCACGMLEDRLDRHAAMPWPRRLLDSAITIPAQRIMERRILSGPGRILTVSSYGRDSLMRLGGDSKRISVLPIPVDAARFAPPVQQAAPGVVGFSGRLGDPRKNVGLLLDAARLAADAGAPFRLRLCGEPDQALKQRASALGLDERVEWLGRIPASSLPDFYRSLDVFAIPSHQEGFGIVGSEAMACGVPVVSTRCGGPTDYVVEGETGHFVDGTPQAMAQALTALMADRNRRQQYSEAARRLVEARFAHDAFAATLAHAWSDVWGDAP